VRAGNPILWLKDHVGFNVWSYEKELLLDNALRLRVIRKSRQIGITTTISLEALWKAFVTRNRLILIVSPSGRQSNKPMTIIQSIVDGNEELAGHVVKKNSSELKLDNGSVILALPNNPDRLRNYSANDIYLDEAAHFLNDEPVLGAIRPMLAATHGTFTIISTPFGKRGLFWDQYNVAVGLKGIDEGVKAYEFYPSWISPLIKKSEIEAQLKNGELTDA
jgi:hypothetical protein